ncbi:MAG: polysaccharide biosynthesis tyrosine autokinase [Verrucomicrobiota bacterium]|nr:polysaccharide biosynthesis tyrosine autokinase [Verrucomicrobiota bacterium]
MASDNLKYGGKPIYSGSAKKSPIYYGVSGNAPYYYGSGNYGRPAAGYDDPSQDPNSLVGTITPARVLRVISQRWITVLVFLLVGLVASFAVYRISPTIYEAKSEFTMQMRSPKTSAPGALGQITEIDYGNTYEEVFNTRLSDWRSEKLITKIVQQYRANHPASTVSDEELLGTLAKSELELVRRSRLITIAVRSGSPQLAADLANSYAEAIESFTDEENRLRCDKAVAQISDQVKKQRSVDERVSEALLNFRKTHKVDNLKSEREIVQQSLQKVTADVLELESEVTSATEWEKVLEAAQETPEDFGALPSAVPRSSEIGQAYTDLQKCKLELNSLLTSFTTSHPDVRIKQKNLDILKQQFTESVSRALATAHGNLASFRNQLAVHRKSRDRLTATLAEIDQKIISAESGLAQIESEKEISSLLLKQLQQDENTARIAAEANNEIVRVGRIAGVPSKPVLPNPIVIFAAGIIGSLALGFLFVLVLDHLEDTVISISDIENRLSLKVLAVLPHVRRKKREDVAKFVAENKYSQFAEAVAGLRNLLDSPRYAEINKVLLVMSTQPAEGKSITSCSLAISNAQAHRKTLLVDFDLRRPRLAKVFGLTDLDVEHSFSHTLQRGGKCNFSELVNRSCIEDLDVIASLKPEGVDPASIMGSSIVSEFFAWARENYDRVIIDSPPFGIVGDVVTLASMVDGVMVVCCPDRTHFRPIQSAVRNLAEAGATVLGVIVNDVETNQMDGAFSMHGHYSYGYRGYSYGYKPEAKAAAVSAEASKTVTDEE